MVHLWVEAYTFGVVSDGLLEVFALYRLVTLYSLGLCHLLASLTIAYFLFVVEICLIVLQLFLISLLDMFADLLGLKMHLPIQ